MDRPARTGVEYVDDWTAEGPSETVAHSTLWRVWAGWGNSTSTHRQLYVWSSPSRAPAAAAVHSEAVLNCARAEEPSESESEVEVDKQSEGVKAAVSEEDCQLTCGCPDRCECGTDWTPEEGGVWEGETQPSTLLEATARMHSEENLILATAGSVTYRVAHQPSGPELEAVMGVGWTISAGKFFADGCNIREIIARGHMKVSTPTGGVASAGLAWTSAVGAGLRALATARPLPQSCPLLIVVAQEQEKRTFCERMAGGDSKEARDSPARCWWPELRRHPCLAE